jgi:uncharacterized membrane protein YdbT with pleckstrin-like domain
MSYVQTVIKPDERILATGHMHWIVYAKGGAVLVLALIVLLFPVGQSFSTMARIVGWLLVVVGFVLLFQAWFLKWTTEIAVTNLRVIQKRGFIRRITGEMNMDKVESVIVDQTLFGRLFDYGSIVVRGTGSGIEGLHFIAKPIELRSAIVVR